MNCGVNPGPGMGHGTWDMGQCPVMITITLLWQGWGLGCMATVLPLDPGDG